MSAVRVVYHRIASENEITYFFNQLREKIHVTNHVLRSSALLLNPLSKAEDAPTVCIINFPPLFGG